MTFLVAIITKIAEEPILLQRLVGFLEPRCAGTALRHRAAGQYLIASIDITDEDYDLRLGANRRYSFSLHGCVELSLDQLCRRS